MERSKKPSEEQKEILLDFMEMNLDFACDRFESADGAFLRQEKWNELSEKLNSVGGAVKDAKKWRKYWTDQKLHVKERRAVLDASVNRSGVNGTRMLKPLTPLESRISTLLAPNAVNGNEAVSDSFPGTSQQMEEQEFIETEYLMEELETIENLEILNTPQVPSTRSLPSTRKRKRAPPGQTRKQDFDDQLLEFEEKKHDLEVQKFEFEKVQREKQFNLQKQQLESDEYYKRRQLDLEERKVALMERKLDLYENGKIFK